MIKIHLIFSLFLGLLIESNLFAVEHEQGARLLNFLNENDARKIKGDFLTLKPVYLAQKAELTFDSEKKTVSFYADTNAKGRGSGVGQELKINFTLSRGLEISKKSNDGKWQRSRALVFEDKFLSRIAEFLPTRLIASAYNPWNRLKSIHSHYEEGKHGFRLEFPEGFFTQEVDLKFSEDKNLKNVEIKNTDGAHYLFIASSAHSN